MIALVWGLLLAAAPGDLTIVSPKGERLVAVRAERGYPAVSAAELGAVLSLVPVRSATGAASLRMLGRQFDFVLDAGYFRFDGRLYTLAGAPYVMRDSLFVPLQWAVEYLPQLIGPRLTYDRARQRLEELPEAVVMTGGGRPAAPGLAAAPVRTPAPAAAAPPSAAPGAPRRRRVVAIDAGHGGVDVGMTGPIGRSRFLQEKTVTLAVARELRRELERRGIGTVLTREADTLIALGDRGRIAGQRGADVFVSIHVNAANPRWRTAEGARGFETYYLAEARTEDARRVERMENASVRFETTAEARRGDPLSFILNDLAQNEHLRESSRMAEIVHGALGGVHPAESRGVKQAGFMVLATSYMPAVLVEIGFGSNAPEARWLISTTGQRLLARAIADGVERYLGEYDRRVGP